MRIAQLVSPRRHQIVDAPAPDPGPGEVRVRVEAVGICGSDMHAYLEGGVGDTPCVYPMVLGHEPAGVVEAVGAGVSGWAPGDRVACEPAIFCYHCGLCQAGRHNLCRKLRFLSMPGEAGFFREQVALPADCLIALPAHLPAAQGALVEPLSVVVHSLRLGAPLIGGTAMVIGAGPIGLLTVAALRLAGVRRLVAVEPLAHRRELARRMGADEALPPDQDLTSYDVDLVFDCAAKGNSVDQCLAAARPGGRVVITGIPSERRTPVDFHRWRRKELAILQVRRANREGHAARDLLARHPALFAPLVTHRRPLEGIDEAFALVAAGDDGVGKLVVCP